MWGSAGNTGWTSASFYPGTWERRNAASRHTWPFPHSTLSSSCLATKNLGISRKKLLGAIDSQHLAPMIPVWAAVVAAPHRSSRDEDPLDVDRPPPARRGRPGLRGVRQRRAAAVVRVFPLTGP